MYIIQTTTLDWNSKKNLFFFNESKKVSLIFCWRLVRVIQCHMRERHFSPSVLCLLYYLSAMIACSWNFHPNLVFANFEAMELPSNLHGFFVVLEIWLMMLQDSNFKFLSADAGEDSTQRIKISESFNAFFLKTTFNILGITILNVPSQKKTNHHPTVPKKKKSSAFPFGWIKSHSRKDHRKQCKALHDYFNNGHVHTWWLASLLVNEGIGKKIFISLAKRCKKWSILVTNHSDFSAKRRKDWVNWILKKSDQILIPVVRQNRLAGHCGGFCSTRKLELKWAEFLLTYQKPSLNKNAL